ncbi:MAG: hypothetical protein AB7W59_14345 [Acidimicrobiia bacterium]
MRSDFLDRVSIRHLMPRPPLRRLLAIAPLAAGALAACGGSDEPASGSSPSTVGIEQPATTGRAAAATTEQAAPASGGGDCAGDDAVSGAVGAAVVLDPGSGPELGCHYYSADGVVSVGVITEDPTNRTVADIERNNIDAERVEGVGDGAYSIVSPGGIVQFGVFIDDRHVLVTIDGVEADEATARAVYDLFA